MERSYRETELNKPVSPIGEGEDTVDIIGIFRKALRYWYWFAIGLLLALLAAFFYIRYTPKVYSVDATIQIKDDKSGGLKGLQEDILSQITLSSASSNIQNEIVVLKSHTLVGRVVKRLGLQTSYIPVGGRHATHVDIYKNSPVLVNPVQFKSHLRSVPLSIATKDNRTFTVSDEETKVNVSAGEIAHLSSGDFMIRRNPGGSDSIYKELTVVVSPLELSIRNFIKRLEISQTDKMSSSLVLKIKTAVPVRGKDFLNTLLAEYQKLGMVEKNKMATNTVEFVSSRLDSLLLELNTVETDMASFMSQSGMADIDEQSKLFLDQVSQVDGQLTEIHLKLNVLDEIQQYMNRPIDEGAMVPSTLGIADPTLQSLIQQYNASAMERSRQLQAGLKSSHPMIKSLDHQIDNLRSSIEENVKNIKKSVQVNLADLEKKRAGFEERIREVPDLQKQFLAIKRKHEVKQSLYNYLLQKREEASLTKEAAVSNSNIVDPALISPQPVAPKGKLIYLGAFLLGLALPGGLLYLKEVFSYKVSSKKEIEELTSVPILAEIMAGKKNNPLVVMSGLRSPISEQFRNLRTNLNFILGKNRHKKTILVTSSMSGEGKSFIALNLAMSYALLGKRAVLLNLDLRRPKLETYLDLGGSMKPGISNFLSGEAELDELADELSYGDRNLFFINSGPTPPNPAELLLQPEMEQLISHLKERFDYIILDTPPIGIVADAQVIGSFADTSLYVVRHNFTKKDQVKILQGLYREKKLPRLGIVLNGIRSKDAYRYGYGDYHSGYYTENGRAESSVYKKIKESLKRSS